MFQRNAVRNQTRFLLDWSLQGPPQVSVSQKAPSFPKHAVSGLKRDHFFYPSIPNGGVE